MEKVYKRIPLSALYGTASAKDMRIKQEIVSRFIRDAAAGDVYEIGGIGGKSELRIIERRGRLCLDRCDGRQPVIMSRANVLRYISTGARLIRRVS